MEIQLLTKVKYKGKWYDPGIVIEKFDDEEGERLVEIGAAKLVEQPMKVNLDEEKLAQLRERAKELGIPRATQMGEAKLLEAIAEKEEELKQQETLAKLREEAKTLGIEVAEDADADAIAAAIETKKAEGGGN